MAAASLLRRWLNLPLIQYVCRRSYGLYLFHHPIFMALEAFRVNGSFLNFAGVAAARFILSLCITEILWRLVEQPAQAYKKGFAACPATESV